MTEKQNRRMYSKDFKRDAVELLTSQRKANLRNSATGGHLIIYSQVDYIIKSPYPIIK